MLQKLVCTHACALYEDRAIRRLLGGFLVVLCGLRKEIAQKAAASILAGGAQCFLNKSSCFARAGQQR